MTEPTRMKLPIGAAPEQRPLLIRTDDLGRTRVILRLADEEVDLSELIHEQINVSIGRTFNEVELRIPLFACQIEQVAK